MLAVIKFLDDYVVTLTGTDNPHKSKDILDAIYRLNYDVYVFKNQMPANELISSTLIDPRINTLKNVGMNLEYCFKNSADLSIEPELHTQLVKVAGRYTKQDSTLMLARCIASVVTTTLIQGGKISPLTTSNLM